MINRICFNDFFFILFTGYTTTYTFTTPETLRKAIVPIVNQPYCRKLLEGNLLTPRMICAGYDNYAKGVFHGDSGGPLSIRVKNKSVLIGVVSWALYISGTPGVYGRVTSVPNWIQSETNI